MIIEFIFGVWVRMKPYKYNEKFWFKIKIKMDHCKNIRVKDE